MKKKTNKKELMTAFDIACDYVAECDRLQFVANMNAAYMDTEFLLRLHRDYEAQATLGNLWLDIHKKLNP